MSWITVEVNHQQAIWLLLALLHVTRGCRYELVVLVYLKITAYVDLV